MVPRALFLSLVQTPRIASRITPVIPAPFFPSLRALHTGMGARGAGGGGGRGGGGAGSNSARQSHGRRLWIPDDAEVQQPKRRNMSSFLLRNARGMNEDHGVGKRKKKKSKPQPQPQKKKKEKEHLDNDWIAMEWIDDDWGAGEERNRKWEREHGRGKGGGDKGRGRGGKAKKGEKGAGRFQHMSTSTSTRDLWNAELVEAVSDAELDFIPLHGKRPMERERDAGRDFVGSRHTKRRIESVLEYDDEEPVGVERHLKRPRRSESPPGSRPRPIHFKAPWYTAPPDDFPPLSAQTLPLHLHRELLLLSEFTQSTPSEAWARSSALSRLDAVVQRRFKGGARVDVFGSVGSGLEVLSSDIDVCITQPHHHHRGAVDPSDHAQDPATSRGLVDLTRDEEDQSDDGSQSASRPHHRALTQGAQSKHLGRIAHALRVEHSELAKRDRQASRHRDKKRKRPKPAGHAHRRANDSDGDGDETLDVSHPTLTARPLSVQLIHRARVPVLKYVDSATGFDVDVTYGRSDGVSAAQWVRGIVDSDWRVRPLVVAVKLLLHSRDLAEVFSGGLGGYALFCMVLGFLRLQSGLFSTTESEIPSDVPPDVPVNSADNLGLLYLRFLLYFGPTHLASHQRVPVFPYEKAVLCPGESEEQAGIRHKSDLRGIMEGNGGDWRSWKLSLQDPLNPSNDVTRGTTQVAAIRGAFGEAYAAYHDAVGRSAPPSNGRQVQGRLTYRNIPVLSEMFEIAPNSKVMKRRRIVEEQYASYTRSTE
ncbi:hypothetical protein M427DRAFT_67441 [Gonapodya prolifera JEL478]|uniref:Poly(A) RNA polymerase mitochondrial-like central palm domain-containing protein n=1 Tax=Gonapodya prolifera (strain JEL478) TaxID=1344416 RepID=A0A139AQ09_GONPJ|nr:hypothetical protein M427DRAFT_67441 [Gonapodya prolifera JEL478]|eukprot:KXS18812.1 hypothetical protein M427DRAFT_67441 [Gonapodya prolifera JEL478]